jgi:ElaB/YqjD/DUF883 family membrane-anchored ribosome-binding protein
MRRSISMNNDTSEAAIQQEMQETRASLTEKLETLEQKVVGTVENATSAVTETVDAIKETVHDTVATVQDGVKDSVDSVKDFLDVPAHVQRRPWLMLGGSVAVGYCLGTLLAPKAQTRLAPAANGNVAPVHSAAALPAAAPAEPNIWDAEVTKLKSLALGVLFGTARELLASSLPDHLGDQVKEVVDSATRKVGGEPLPSSDWAKLCEPAPLPSELAPEPESGTRQPSAEYGNGHHGARRW